MKNLKDPKTWKNPVAIMAVIIGVVLFVVLWHLPDVLHGIGTFLGFFRPVFAGIVIAYVLNPLANVFEKRVLKGIKKEAARRFLAVLCAILLLIILFIILIAFLVPQLISSVTTFIGNLNGYVNSLNGMMEQLGVFMEAHYMDMNRLLEFVEGILSSLRNILPSTGKEIVGILSGIGSSVMDFVLAFIMAIYFLVDKERIKKACKAILMAFQKPATFTKTINFFSWAHNILIRYIVCDLFDALLIGVINFVFFLISGMPYGAIVATVAGVCNLAPTFGPIIGWAIGSGILVLVNPWYALYFTIFTLILQTFDGYILKPRLFGDVLGVPGVIVLVCVIVGGRIFGVWGVLLAIPFSAMAYFILSEYIGKRSKKTADALAAEEAAGGAALIAEDGSGDTAVSTEEKA